MTLIKQSIFLVLTMMTNMLLAEGEMPAVVNPHSIAMDEYKPQCMTCHAGQNPGAMTMHQGLVAGAVNDGVKSCITCHESSEAEHMIGQQPDFKVPDDLPLDQQGRITCLTCHRTHGPLYSEKRWTSVSWLERFTTFRGQHKTYLLRRSNADGGLCRSCHDS